MIDYNIINNNKACINISSNNDYYSEIRKENMYENFDKNLYQNNLNYNIEILDTE